MVESLVDIGILALFWRRFFGYDSYMNISLSFRRRLASQRAQKSLLDSGGADPNRRELQTLQGMADRR